MQDICKGRKQMASSRRHNAIWEALADATERFFETDSLDQSIQEMLQLLGKTTAVSRVYVFENHKGEEGAFLARKRQEWTAPGIPLQTSNPSFPSFSWSGGGMGRWAGLLEQGRLIQGHVMDFPQSEQEVLASQEIQSILAIPVFVGRKWWGFIGFDECSSQRKWSTAEIRALRTAGGILGSVIQRKLIEDELRASEAQKTAILDASIDRIRHVDLDMRIIWANKATAAQLNVSPEELVGQVCHALFVDKDTPCEGCPTQKTRKTGKIERAVMYKSKVKGVEGPTYWDVYCVPLRNEAGEIESFIQISRNITDQKRLMDALQDREQFFRDISNSMSDWVWQVDKEGKYTYVSEKVKQILGYDPEELIGTSAFDLLQKEQAPRFIELFRNSVLEKKPIVNLENWCLTKEGGKICLLANGIPILDDKGDLIGYRGTDKDITSWKLTEEHIHTLTHELMKTQENERQMISRELHDRIGQDLSILKIGIDTLFNGQIGIPVHLRDRASELSKTLQETIMAVRDLSYDLRPPSLDQQGLIQTIFQYCEDFSEKSRLSVEFTSAGMDAVHLDFDTEINLYRLIQEGLVNIRKHAAASHATIRLVASAPNIILRIEDNGRGFDVKMRLANITNEKRMGLRSMQERVNLLKGKMRIRSRIGEGTKIFIEVPYRDKAHG